jgi:5-methyltetrahydropteroyltriglutamate--homocysteine methyltransferase
MFAKAEGVSVDSAALDRLVGDAMTEVVKRQRESGVDIVSDGDMSKPGYATYVKDRLSGFGGLTQPLVMNDLNDFPGVARRVSGDPGRIRRTNPACDGPVAMRDLKAARTEIAAFRKALSANGASAEQAFVCAASPGVISIFMKNTYYPSHEAYIWAIAAAMREEYEAIAEAGLVLQIDCPDLAMGRHIGFAELDLEAFRRIAALHIEALDWAVRDIDPARLRMHLCWGNYDGPHHCDVPLADIIDLVLKARPSILLFEAANARHAHEWQIFERVRLPEGKILVPGVIESRSNIVEHPELIAQRLTQYAKLVHPQNVMAGSDCGYGTNVGQAQVDPDVVWAKMRAMAEGARLASTRFWL